jgi:hypothetical protein
LNPVYTQRPQQANDVLKNLRFCAGRLEKLSYLFEGAVGSPTLCVDTPPPTHHTAAVFSFNTPPPSIATAAPCASTTATHLVSKKS